MSLAGGRRLSRIQGNPGRKESLSTWKGSPICPARAVAQERAWRRQWFTVRSLRNQRDVEAIVLPPTLLIASRRSRYAPLPFVLSG